MKFTKMHGLGNDFVLIDCMEQEVKNPSQLAQEMCDRNFGIGADGLVLILPSDLAEADYRMRIFNPDGSEPQMCGNAIRCFAKYLYERELTEKTKLNIETLAGIIRPELILKDGAVELVKVDMGEPILRRSEIPMEGEEQEQVIKEELAVGTEVFEVTAVSMGNPHCIIFVDDIEEIELSNWGPQIETHKVFPEDINVEFIEVLNQDEIEMRVWERGAGITLACGTGACASTVAAILNGYTNRKITVHLAGGDLVIEWADNNNRVYMSGPATEVFEGEWKL
ncbi:diaminopimelate epimerase [Orenia metallireducens]|jgi:diaminopimelate epimerase|uniref:Diaminopimelate epimerase n=1 Tax=Orenia metallireducens TaxID=1413210 RepID=A0A285HSQ5_9FIRM|nr:diaminopimelate epimerase [Orenia metallireducens]PRX24054.1 diaminopimelate epimerase [Orenia metallireducens]SNY38734.1 diaminopimelate epimerase [Orenia metallireducens]